MFSVAPACGLPAACRPAPTEQPWLFSCTPAPACSDGGLCSAARLVGCRPLCWLGQSSGGAAARPAWRLAPRADDRLQGAQRVGAPKVGCCCPAGLQVQRAPLGRSGRLMPQHSGTSRRPGSGKKREGEREHQHMVHQHGVVLHPDEHLSTAADLSSKCRWCSQHLVACGARSAS